MESSSNGDADSGNALLQPGQLLRPSIRESTARALVSKLYGLQVTSFQELSSYVDRNYLVQVDRDYDHCNALGEGGLATWPHGFVFKILNSTYSKQSHVDAEHEMIKILTANGFNCCQPVCNLAGQEKSLEWIPHEYDEINSSSCDDKSSGKSAGGFHTVRLLKYIPGKCLVEVPYTPRLLYQVGKCLGSLDNAHEGFHHPALDVHQTIWGLENVPHLKNFTYAISDPDRRRLVEEVIEQFEMIVIPKVHLFNKGVIHGDFNEQNIIVAESTGSNALESDKYDIHGIIDFGHSKDTYYVFEISITMMYMILDSAVVDPVEAGGHVLAGYLSERGLNPDELSVLRVCVAARFAQSLVMSAFSYSKDPGNEYLLTTAKNGWPRLKLIWNHTDQELYDVWKKVIDRYQHTI